MAGLPRRYTETHRPEAVDPVDLFGSIDRAFDRMLEVRLGRSPSAKPSFTDRGASRLRELLGLFPPSGGLASSEDARPRLAKGVCEPATLNRPSSPNKAQNGASHSRDGPVPKVEALEGIDPF